ncbi:UNVERIFIED_CONTAM: 1,3-beta-glucanosyltransferase [Siphonaria sp. JEL0065]|nr:1,3-beta-glucanosyltransferase [Siphonaria sp. JEL0065]
MTSIPLVAVVPKSFSPLIFAANVGNGILDLSNSTDTQLNQTQYPHIQTEYRAQVYIGTPPRLYNFLLDTGSYDMWVFGNACQSPSCQSALHFYNVNASTTGVDLKTKAPTITYADGEKYSGVRVRDTVQLGGLVVPEFQFTQVDTFIAPWNPDDSSDSDGIIGMGFHPSGMHPVVPSLAEELISKKIIKNGVFSYYIAQDEQTGVVSLGGYNTSFFQNSSVAPSWAPYLQDDTLSSGKISLPLLTVSVNNVVVETFSNHTSQTDGSFEGNTGSAILDTGTSQGIVSYALVDGIANALMKTRPGSVNKIYYSGNDTSQYTYSVPCDAKTENGGPIVTLAFASGLTLSITAMEYISMPQASGDTVFCQLNLRAVKGGYSGGTFLIGNTFLKRYITIFDYDNQRVGFALGADRSVNHTLGFNATTISYIPLKVELPNHNVDAQTVAIVTSLTIIGVLLTVTLAVLYYRGKICGKRRDNKVVPGLYNRKSVDCDGDLDLEVAIYLSRESAKAEEEAIHMDDKKETGSEKESASVVEEKDGNVLEPGHASSV